MESCTILCIGSRLGEWVSGQQTLVPELALDPIEEQFHLRLTVGQPVQVRVLAGQLAFADMLLDRVQRADLRQRLAAALRRRRVDLEEAASCMRATLGVSQAGGPQRSTR
nr:hypothetical protein [Acidihalobacter yilgarnensis]